MLLAGIAIALLALNLRTFAGSLGVTLPEVSAGLGISTTVAGILTTLPVVVFALIGPLAPRLAVRIGLRGGALVTLVVVGTGLLARAFSDATWLFVALTALAPAGVAIGNVILPPLVKHFFPGRVALMSSVGTALIVLGGAISSVVTVSVTQQSGSWRAGLGVWGVLALLAAIPWLARSLHTAPSPDTTAARPRWRTALRSKVAWALALSFATQSTAAYVGFGWLAAVLRSDGVDPARAGLMVAVWSLLGVPMGLLIPALLRHRRSAALMPWLWSLTSVAGWLGLALGHGHGGWAWTVLLGIGSGAFPWTLAMVALHGRSVADTAVLSGFVQSVGYLLAATGPFGFGALHDLTGSWTPSLLGMALIAGLMGLAGAVAVRSPAYGA